MNTGFEWDAAKNALNLAKHGISLEDAQDIFAGPILVAEDTRREYGEVRKLAIGSLAGRIVIVVVYTEREGKLRLISARKANRGERREYHDHLKKKA